MNPIFLAVIFVAFVLIALQWWQLAKLRRRFGESLAQSDGDSLETALNRNFKHLGSVDSKLDKLIESYRQLTASSALASQKISVVRFNPFGDTGGDQSFVLAVLDAHNSGYVLTSIHGREGTRVYVKPIDYAKSKYTLSKEEQQAIEQAIKRVPPQEDQ